MTGNESAFPVPTGYYAISGSITSEGGLTKREYFAGLAMQGMLANSWCTEAHGETSESVARRAVSDADALLAELAK